MSQIVFPRKPVQLLAAPPMASKTTIAVRLTPSATNIRVRFSDRLLHIPGYRSKIRTEVASKATTRPTAHNVCLFVGRQPPEACSDSFLGAGSFRSTGFPHVPTVVSIAKGDESQMNPGPRIPVRIPNISR
jgi:hypothetical protein